MVIGLSCLHPPVSEVRPIQPAAITTPRTAAASSSKTTLVLGSRLCITETNTDSNALMYCSKTGNKQPYLWLIEMLNTQYKKTKHNTNTLRNILLYCLNVYHTIFIEWESLLMSTLLDFINGHQECCCVKETQNATMFNNTL